MINLLPPNEIKEFLREMSWRLVLVLGILLVIFFICFSLILFSIQIFISGKVAAQKITYEQEEKTINPELQDVLEKLNLTIDQLDRFYNQQFDVIEVLEKVSESLSSDTYLTNLSITFQTEKVKNDQGEEKEKEKIVCSLSGFSSSSDLLRQFKENLEKKEIFERINFPPLNWLKLTDIHFIASFVIQR